MSQPPTFGLVQIALVSCLVVFAIARQFMTRPVAQPLPYVLPVAILGYGVYGLAQQPALGWAELAALGVSVALSVGLGVARGASMRVWIDGSGRALTKATLLTLVLWIVSILAKVALNFFAASQTRTVPNVAELCIIAGTTVGAQAAVIWLRSLALLSPSPVAAPGEGS